MRKLWYSRALSRVPVHLCHFSLNTFVDEGVGKWVGGGGGGGGKEEETGGVFGEKRGKFSGYSLSCSELEMRFSRRNYSTNDVLIRTRPIVVVNHKIYTYRHIKV